MEKTCKMEDCGNVTNNTYCSAACKQKAYRERQKVHKDSPVGRNVTGNEAVTIEEACAMFNVCKIENPEVLRFDSAWDVVSFIFLKTGKRLEPQDGVLVVVNA